MIAIWRDLLGGDIEADSDFFDLGGHSLLALQLANRLRQHFGLELSIQEILIGRAHTPQQQAGLVEAAGGRPPAATAAAKTAAAGGDGGFAELLAWVDRQTEQDAAGAARIES